MKFRPILITPPVSEPVTSLEAAQHCVLWEDYDYTALDTMISAAVSYLDGLRGVLGRAMITQTWEVKFDRLDRMITLPVPDVDGSTVAVFYRDPAGNEQQVPTAAVETHAIPEGTLVAILNSFAIPALSTDTLAPVRVRFDCGFGDAGDVPAGLRAAIMQMVARMYDDRVGADAAIATDAVRSLIEPYRWVAIA